MNICLLQSDPQAGRKNIKYLEWTLKQINADLYVLPELFTTGFDYIAKHGPTDAEVIPDGVTCRQVMSFVRNRSSAVVCGLLEEAGNYFYNIAAVIGDAWIERYRQKYPAFSSQGRVLPVLTGDFQKITLPSLWSMGLMVCSDHYRAEEFFQEYQKRGANAIVLIADSPTRSWINAFPILCGQYGLPAIVCNAAGPNGGESCVINAGGEFVPLRVGDKEYKYLGDTAVAALAVL